MSERQIDRLFDAAIYGDVSRMEAALTISNININAVEHYSGRACLHIAAESGHVEVIKCLLARGADINIRTARDETPLHLAVNGFHKAAVETLLDAGAPISSVNQGRGRIIAYPFLRHYVEINPRCLQILELLLDRGMDVNPPAGDDCKYTLIGDAARMGSLTIVQLLVRRGAVVPTDILTEVDDHDTAAFLLECGARIVCAPEKSVIVYAASTGNRWLLELYLSCASHWDILASKEALHQAATNGHLRVVETLLDQGWDVNALSDELRKTSLSAACSGDYRETDVVEALLDAGADIDSRDIKGRTALHWAADYSQDKIIQCLLDHGANSSVRDDRGQSPLLDAAHVITTIAWAKSPNDDVYLPLTSFKTFASFLHNDVDLNVQDREGRTALHILACAYGSPGAMRASLLAARLLIEKGADINIHNNKGETAGELIAMLDHQGVLQEKAWSEDPHRYCYMMLLQPPGEQQDPF